MRNTCCTTRPPVRWGHTTTNPERPLFHLRMPNRCANYSRGRDTTRWVVYLGWMPLKEWLACEGRLKLRLSSLFHQRGSALTQRIKGTSEITSWWLYMWKEHHHLRHARRVNKLGENERSVANTWCWRCSKKVDHLERGLVNTTILMVLEHLHLSF